MFGPARPAGHPTDEDVSMAVQALTPAPTAVVFDLDGTLTDSAPVITRTLAETLAAHGYGGHDPATLVRFVGPPLRETFHVLTGLAEEDTSALVADYRARYAGRMHEAVVFPGVREVVAGLHRAGVPLAVATSKVRGLAREILATAGLAPFFTVIEGASPDERVSVKADVVGEALAGLRGAGADVSRTVMVGDRHHDVDGAAHHGVGTVFVRWGYGRPDEADGALAVAADATELARLLGL
jgi:phosphoglycolate phosphatase